MEFIRLHNEPDRIQAVYDILFACGQDMLENQGLEHWRTPYSVEKITAACLEKAVYLAMLEGKPVATFQLAQKGDMLELTKFAVSPTSAGNGIGGQCLAFMEDECQKQGLRGICLDVYDKSTVAVRFYERKGFLTTGKKPSGRFEVLLMEKLV